jgi:hypothetical protein
LRAFRTKLRGASVAAIAAVGLIVCGAASAEDKFLSEVVDFTGTFTYLNAKVPAFILVAVRNGETAFTGLGSITDKQDKKPAPDTMFRIGSISKAFCGEVLANMVLDGKLHFSDPVQDRLGYEVTLPKEAGIRSGSSTWRRTRPVSRAKSRGSRRPRPIHSARTPEKRRWQTSRPIRPCRDATAACSVPVAAMVVGDRVLGPQNTPTASSPQWSVLGHNQSCPDPSMVQSAGT